MSKRPTALVTGSSSGFGADVSAELVRRGWVVYAGARRTDRMDGLRELGARVVRMDVRDRESVTSVVTRMMDEHGRIDVAFANAGYGSYGTIECVPIDEVQRQFDVNVLGVARVVEAVLPHMRARREGRVIVTASVLSHLSTVGTGWYAATKHALKAVAEALRQEVRAFGIDVVLIEPGMVRTEFDQVALAALDRVEHADDYVPLVSAFRRKMTEEYAEAPDTRTTVDAMVRAATVKRPRTVYRTTADSKWIPKVRGLLGDRWVDRLVLRHFTTSAESS